jgi:hypothetical protein
MKTQTTGRRAGPAAPLAAAALMALALLAFLPAAARAQWTQPDAGGNTNYPNGKVGVGTASPSGKLSVVGADSLPDDTVTLGVPAGSVYGPSLKLDATGSAGGHRWLMTSTGPNNTGGAGRLRFFDLTAGAARMVLDAAGNVGIGTSAPLNQLHVESAVSLAGVRVAGSGGGLMNFIDTGAAADAKLYQLISQGGVLRLGLVNDAQDAYVQQYLLVARPSGNIGFGTAGPASPAGFARAVHLRDASSASFVADAGGSYRNEFGVSAGGGWVGTFDGIPLRLVTGGAERVRIDASGRLGVGTTAPLQRLQVGGNNSTPTATPDAISLGGTYSNAALANPKLRLYDDGAAVYGAGVSNGQLDFVVPAGARYVWGADGVERMRLTATGDLTVTGSVSATYQDVAEWVPSTQKLSAGTVVVLDQSRTNHVLASVKPYDTKVAGVVSDSPGVILGVGGEGKLKVATTGRVRVRVDATRAPIKIGDLIVTSDVEGVAMKSVPVDLGGVTFHRPGTIIGKALEPLAGGVGEILVLLSLQ